MSKRIVKIYTRTGDEGKTAIRGGRRLFKDSPVIVACGELDELNSLIGWAVVLAAKKEKEILRSAQRNIFVVGAELAAGGKISGERVLKKEKTEEIEKNIDWYQARARSVNNFILPGGSEAAARLHVCRTVCRRAERAVVSLNKCERINPEIPRFLNRLSDLFYILARWENKKSKTKEIIWDGNHARSASERFS